MNMDVKKMAKTYAEDKAKTALEQLIADAYEDGYVDGCKSLSNSDANNIKNDIIPEFIDLGLPSGTKWAIDYIRNDRGQIRYLSYSEAKKYSLPTQEQWLELRSCCTFKEKMFYIETDKHFLYSLPFVGLKSNYSSSQDVMSIWLATDEIINGEALRALYNNTYHTINRLGIDILMPVLLVK